MTEEKLEEVSSYYGKVLSGAAKAAYAVLSIASAMKGYYVVPCKRKPKNRSYISRCRHYHRVIRKSDDDSFRRVFAECGLASLQFRNRLYVPMRKVRIPLSHYIKYSVLCLIHKKKGR